MDIASLRRRIERLIHTDSSVFAQHILNSGFQCMHCGWCCCENFHILVRRDIFRPSNAISIFPEDINRIVKAIGMEWDEIAEPDIYSCLRDGSNILALGWILKRSQKGDCIFHRGGECTIYRWRPLICRCYPFFLDEQNVEEMHCEGMKNNSEKNFENNAAVKMGLLLKRYEIKKLQNYINIIKMIENKLILSNLCSLPRNYCGNVLVCDGKSITPRTMEGRRL